jgi:regulator of replication initiation timing
MNIQEQLAQLLEQNKKLKTEKKELVRELNYLREIEKEAVRRYGRVADELLLYYIHYGRIDIKEIKKKK